MHQLMDARRVRLCGAMLAVLLLDATSGCGATVYVGSTSIDTPDRPVSTARARTTATEHAQRPGTCQIAPPQLRVPTGEWTATETILHTNAIDACAGEQLVRPWDFRRRCRAGHCKTYLYTVSYYGLSVAEVAPAGRGRYLASFPPEPVPCPHRPGEDAGTNQDQGTIVIWWSADKGTLHGLGRDQQVGPCGGGPPTTSSYEARRTDPAVRPLAAGP